MVDLIQILVDALSVGGLYALTALGIGLIFSVMRLANFAHAEFVTIAAYLLFAFSGQPLVVALTISIVGAVLLAILTERIAFRPLRNADAATMLIASFAVSMFLQKLLVFSVGSRVKTLDPLPMLSGPISFGGVQISALKLATIVVCAVLLMGLTFFLKKTRFGLQMRAAADNFTMSRLVGVRANTVIAIAFGLSGFLAAVVALLFAAQTGFVQPRFGLQLVIIAFVATVIGGLGNLPGAAAGGFLVGIISTLLQAFLPPDLRPFREAFLFTAVILVLLARPQGLFPARGLKERV
ncbi:branched-chain amino acid ABC transporter permease [Rhizobium sp. KVB221]|uniref:Branched-chain amino acid ABC transporter permease n=1 Tax=Rhizobium setariae TaxID=2801340 RepID=A0A937CMF3_9HYPH|nr:branched-chain amino acid ABC transporter permease [Rhizobium setariae]MBL0374255.1 branched-chain amino acid ABC transporter permease [Rhizobium setariae]